MNDLKEADALFSEFTFPTHIYFFTEDTSNFQEAHDLLISLGLIPKPLNGNARPLEERTCKLYLPWEQEDCCVLPVHGREHMAESEAYGWGLYRVCFRGPKSQDELENHFKKNKIQINVDFKYCWRNTPKECFFENSIPPNDPMKKDIIQVYNILKPTAIVDYLGEPINFPY